MLTRNQIESELSLAYLQAIAASASFAVDVPHIDTDSVDAVIAARGKLSADSLRVSPRIEIQLKATFNWSVNKDGNIAYPLPIKNYDDLRGQTVLPRLLVLLCLPADATQWLTHSSSELTLRNCAHWVSLRGANEVVGVAKPTVYVPVANILSPDAISHLMMKASKLQDL